MPAQLLYQNLIDRAQASHEPVTAVNAVGEHRTVYRAAVEHDGTVWRADIDTLDEREEFDSTTCVSFAKCSPESDAEIMREWSSLATGRLGGPQTLPAWEQLFMAFNAALGRYNREARPENTDLSPAEENYR